VELPRLEPLWNRYREKGLSVIAIEARRDSDRARTFIDANKLTYHLLENDAQHDVVGGTYGVGSFPTSFLIDGDGSPGEVFERVRQVVDQWTGRSGT